MKAAASIARDAAEGRLDPAQLDVQLAAACKELMGTVVGPDDPLFALQLHIARQMIAAGGIPTDELSEWAVVQRRREGADAATDSTAVDGQGGAEPPAGADVVTEADSAALEPHSAENDAVPADADAEAGELAADTAPAPHAAPGCGCAAHTAERGPRFGGTVLARGRGLPGQ
ncbi:hypothetical protein A5768_00675 [Mycolicibacterium fortuitum]|nr:hypothetical protein A5768_00675 [Mycolicibacterium fortuitum]